MNVTNQKEGRFWNKGPPKMDGQIWKVQKSKGLALFNSKWVWPGLDKEFWKKMGNLTQNWGFPRPRVGEGLFNN